MISIGRIIRALPSRGELKFFEVHLLNEDSLLSNKQRVKAISLVEATTGGLYLISHHNGKYYIQSSGDSMLVLGQITDIDKFTNVMSIDLYEKGTAQLGSAEFVDTDTGLLSKHVTQSKKDKTQTVSAVQEIYASSNLEIGAWVKCYKLDDVWYVKNIDTVMSASAGIVCDFFCDNFDRVEGGLTGYWAGKTGAFTLVNGCIIQGSALLPKPDTNYTFSAGNTTYLINHSCKILSKNFVIKARFKANEVPNGWNGIANQYVSLSFGSSSIEDSENAWWSNGIIVRDDSFKVSGLRTQGALLSIEAFIRYAYMEGSGAVGGDSPQRCILSVKTATGLLGESMTTSVVEVVNNEFDMVITVSGSTITVSLAGATVSIPRPTNLIQMGQILMFQDYNWTQVYDPTDIVTAPIALQSISASDISITESIETGYGFKNIGAEPKVLDTVPLLYKDKYHKEKRNNDGYLIGYTFNPNA